MRIAAAVLAGLLSMMVLIVVATAVVAAALPSPGAEPGALYLTVNLLYSGAFAAVGGWVSARLGGREARTSPRLGGSRARTSARLAGSRARTSVLSLAAVVAALGLASAVGGAQPGQPAWYPWAMLALGPAGVLLGGLAVRGRAAASASHPGGATPPRGRSA